MNFDFKKIIPHLVVLLIFIIASLAYFNPVLSGKKIFQSDIQQSRGMSRQQVDFRKENKEETYWVDNAFGGMPTYLIGAQYPNNFVKSIDKTLRFLPRPADYLFLYFIGLYILFLVLKVDYRLALLGALAFGFSTYLIIILGVGHNAKAHAIAYMPVVLAGVLSVFQKKYLWGGLLLALSLALEIYTGHFQITYYLMYVVLAIGLVHLIHAFRKGQLADFFRAVGVMILALMLALASNASNLMASQEYTAFSTRGDTGLSISKSGKEKKEAGLSYDYITEYSYGIAETFNLFIPRFMGGASTESLSENSHTFKSLTNHGVPRGQALQIAENMPTYWGKQPIVAAPAYIGAGVIFLFILALYLVKGRIKWWVSISCILALLLSWGDNFSSLTKFFINYVPLYSKFRTVAMIQVILELLIPFFGIYGLTKLFSPKIDKAVKWKALKWATIISAGICLFFILLKNFFFDFKGAYDNYYMESFSPDFVEALKKDRIAMLTADSIRSLVFVLLFAGIIFAYLKEKLSKNLGIALFTVLVLVDLISVDRKYVNEDDFISEQQFSQAFVPNQADLQIMEDKSHYRVLDLSVNPMNSARASYFHNSLGGYHAAKPGRMQELFDFHISELNEDVLNMLNTKYFIFEHEGQIVAQENEEANGNAWFIDEVKWADSANDEINSLKDLDTKTSAVFNKKYEKDLTSASFNAFQGDTIYMTSYLPGKLTYRYKLTENRPAVFSEIYYPHGWKATVNGKDLNILQADYVLRAVELPAGEGEVVFTFEPQIVKTGSSITLTAGMIFALFFAGGLFFGFKGMKSDKEEAA